MAYAITVLTPAGAKNKNMESCLYSNTANATSKQNV
jgi:hypothetical protein